MFNIYLEHLITSDIMNSTAVIDQDKRHCDRGMLSHVMCHGVGCHGETAYIDLNLAQFEQ